MGRVAVRERWRKRCAPSAARRQDGRDGSHATRRCLAGITPGRRTYRPWPGGTVPPTSGGSAAAGRASSTLRLRICPAAHDREGRPTRGALPAAARAPAAGRPDAPAHLDEFVGQEHLVGERGAAATDASRAATSPSILLWGPPGTGKTSSRGCSRAVGAPVRDALGGDGRRRRRPRADRRAPQDRIALHGDARPSCSSTRSIASTRRSRTRCCRTSRTARSRSSARRPRTPTSRSTRRSSRGCASGGSRR